MIKARSSKKLDSEVEPIVAWLASIRSEIEIVGLEAGTLTQYLTYGFQAAGYPIVCMEARGVHAALQAMRNKTDKNEARGIAQILRTGWYRRYFLVVHLLSSRLGDISRCNWPLRATN